MEIILEVYFFKLILRVDILSNKPLPDQMLTRVYAYNFKRHFQIHLLQWKLSHNEVCPQL